MIISLPSPSQGLSPKDQNETDATNQTTGGAKAGRGCSPVGVRPHDVAAEVVAWVRINVER